LKIKKYKEIIEINNQLDPNKKKKKGINQLVVITKVCLICCYSIITSEALIIGGYEGLPDYLETLC
jgi:hypothetical protein